jgi:DNA-binding NarL/FixJ family response regulator
VTLLVQDDGQGFDPVQQGDRFGLRAISDGAQALGATVEVDSLAGWGTRIRARFPYRPPDEQAGPRLRVLIAASRPMVRAGIVRLLSGTEPGIEVIGEVATAADALDGCRELSPDVVLADLDVTGLLLGDEPGLAVVGLCEVGDEKLVASAIRAGARGCVDMSADGPELARAVVAAGRGQAILSGPVLRQLHRGLQEDEAGPALTDRERQVRSLMEQGLPDKLIAEQLVLSIKTVEKHAGAVLRKTGARNRTELAAHASGARARPVAR